MIVTGVSSGSFPEESGFPYNGRCHRPMKSTYPASPGGLLEIASGWKEETHFQGIAFGVPLPADPAQPVS